jgi:hypothetical protein
MRGRDLVVACIITGCVAILSAGRAVAKDTSTPEERKQWVEITRKLESDPLNKELDNEGEAAVKQVADVKDFHVLLCPQLYSLFGSLKSPHRHTLARQFMLASAAYTVENPDLAAGTHALYVAAAESVLKTYQAILKREPDARDKVLDDLVKKQRHGELSEFVQCP